MILFGLNLLAQMLNVMWGFPCRVHTSMNPTCRASEVAVMFYRAVKPDFYQSIKPSGQRVSSYCLCFLYIVLDEYVHARMHVHVAQICFDTTLHWWCLFFQLTHRVVVKFLTMTLFLSSYILGTNKILILFLIVTCYLFRMSVMGFGAAVLKVGLW